MHIPWNKIWKRTDKHEGLNRQTYSKQVTGGMTPMHQHAVETGPGSENKQWLNAETKYQSTMLVTRHEFAVLDIN